MWQGPDRHHGDVVVGHGRSHQFVEHGSADLLGSVCLDGGAQPLQSDVEWLVPAPQGRGVRGVSFTLQSVIQRSQAAEYEQNKAAVRGQLDDAAWSVATAQGRAMSVEQAVAYALV